MDKAHEKPPVDPEQLEELKQETAISINEELQAKFDSTDNAGARETRELLAGLSEQEQALYWQMKELQKKQKHEKTSTDERLNELKKELRGSDSDKEKPKVPLETPSLSKALSQEIVGDSLQKLKTKDAFWKQHQSELRKFMDAREDDVLSDEVSGEQLKLYLEMKQLVSKQVNMVEGAFAELQMRTKNIEAIRNEFETTKNTGDDFDYIRKIGALSTRLSAEEKEINGLNLEISANARDLDDMTVLYRKLTHTEKPLDSILPSLKAEVDIFAGRSKEGGIKIEVAPTRQTRQEIAERPAKPERQLDPNNWGDFYPLLKQDIRGIKNGVKSMAQKVISWWKKL